MKEEELEKLRTKVLDLLDLQASEERGWHRAIDGITDEVRLNDFESGYRTGYIHGVNKVFYKLLRD